MTNDLLLKEWRNCHGLPIMSEERLMLTFQKRTINQSLVVGQQAKPNILEMYSKCTVYMPTSSYKQPVMPVVVVFGNAL